MITRPIFLDVRKRRARQFITLLVLVSSSALILVMMFFVISYIAAKLSLCF